MAAICRCQTPAAKAAKHFCNRLSVAKLFLLFCAPDLVFHFSDAFFKQKHGRLMCFRGWLLDKVYCVLKHIVKCMITCFALGAISPLHLSLDGPQDA